MSLLNIGAGLSKMGAGIAQFAGQAGLEQQKSDLENQRLQLANQLQTQRESLGRSEEHQYKTEEQASGEVQSEKLVQATSQADVTKAQQIAKNAADLQATLGSDPQYLKALSQLADSNMNDAQRAQAESLRKNAALTAVQTQTAQALQDAKKALAEAATPGEVAAAQRNLAIAEYNSHDEVQRASSLAAIMNADLLQLKTLQTGYLTGTATKDQVDMAQHRYEISRSMADQAAKDLPSFNAFSRASGGGNKTAPISSFDKTPGQPSSLMNPSP